MARSLSLLVSIPQLIRIRQAGSRRDSRLSASTGNMVRGRLRKTVLCFHVITFAQQASLRHRAHLSRLQTEEMTMDTHKVDRLYDHCESNCTGIKGRIMGRGFLIVKSQSRNLFRDRFARRPPTRPSKTPVFW